MKKIISLVLASVMLFSLASCTKTITGPTKAHDITTDSTTLASGAASTTATASTPPTTAATSTTEKTEEPEALTAYGVLYSAINKTNSLSTFCATSETEIILNYFGMDQSSVVKTKMTAAQANTQTPVYSASSSYTAYGETEETEVYFENGYYYVTDRGVKAKIPQTESSDGSYDYFSQFKETMLPLSEKALVSALLTEYNGGKNITADIGADEARAFYSDIIDGMINSFTTNELGTITFDGAHLTCIVNSNGYVSSYSIKFNFTWNMIYSGYTQSIGMAIEWSAKFENPGNTYSVDPPHNYAYYILIDYGSIAYNLLRSTVETAQSLDDMRLEYCINVDMEELGVQTSFDVVQTILAQDINSNPAVYRTAYSYAKKGLPYNEMYYENGYYYFVVGDETFKFSENVAKEDYKSVNDIFDLIKSLSEESLESAELVLEKGGERHITGLIEEEYFKATYASLIERVNYLMLGENVTSYNIYVPYINIYISTDDYIEMYEVIYTVEVTGIVNGEERSVYADVTVYIGFYNPGEDIEMYHPTGAENFPEIYNDIVS